MDEKSHSFHEGHHPPRQFGGDSPRARSANEWREFWRARGERELAEVLDRTWSPMADGDASRVATLLGSRAPGDALAAELARMRSERGAPANGAEDAEAAAAIVGWFATV